jgi:hypothetical protein
MCLIFNVGGQPLLLLHVTNPKTRGISYFTKLEIGNVMNNLWKRKGEIHILTLKVMYDCVKVIFLFQLVFES